jgi:hypothetical protein
MAPSAETPSVPRSCAQCQGPLNARYCPACGADSDDPLNSAQDDGWGRVAKALAGTDKADGLLAAGFRLVKQPIAAPVCMALDPADTHALKIFGLVMPAALLAFYAMPIKVMAAIEGTSASFDTTAIPKLMTVQWIIIIIMLPLYYYAFRWLSGTTRKPYDFFKISLLGIAGSAVVQVVSLVGLIILWAVTELIGIINVPETDAAMKALASGLLMASGLAAVAYYALMQARFWEIKRWLLVFAALVIVSVVLSPLTNALLRLFVNVGA